MEKLLFKNGMPVVQGGKFIRVADDGTDEVVDTKILQEKINRLTTENAVRAEEILALKKDPNSNVAAKAVKALGDENHTLNSTIAAKDNNIRDILVTSKFTSSPHFSGITPTTILDPLIAVREFGKNFKVEENDAGQLRVRAYDDKGVLIKNDHGLAASFDEAITALISVRPDRNKILRATSMAGSGSAGNSKSDAVPANISNLKNQYRDCLANQRFTDAVSLKRVLFDAGVKMM